MQIVIPPCSEIVQDFLLIFLLVKDVLLFKSQRDYNKSIETNPYGHTATFTKI